MFASFAAYGAVSVFSGPVENDPLICITDAQILDTADGPILFVTTRGDGWLTAFDLGNVAGDAVEIGAWAIDASYLQLETTDLAIHDTGANTFELFLAGLNDNDLQGVTFSPMEPPLRSIRQQVGPLQVWTRPISVRSPFGMEPRTG